MYRPNSRGPRSFACGVLILLALPILILSVAPSASAQPSVAPPAPAPATVVAPTPPAVADATKEPSAPVLKGWSKGMARTPLPHPGCFTSSYPDTGWRETPCTTAPARPYPPRRGPRPQQIGNGNDVSALVTGNPIFISEGSFDSVTGVTSELGYATEARHL